MTKKIIWIFILLIIAGSVSYFLFTGSSGNENSYNTIAVEKGTIVDKALAVGKIEPRPQALCRGWR
jgi:hypothetical protein